MAFDESRFKGFTREGVEPNTVLGKAMEAGLRTVVVVAWGEDGDFYFATSSPDECAVLSDLEEAKRALLDIAAV